MEQCGLLAPSPLKKSKQFGEDPLEGQGAAQLSLHPLLSGFFFRVCLNRLTPVASRAQRKWGGANKNLQSDFFFYVRPIPSHCVIQSGCLGSQGFDKNEGGRKTFPVDMQHKIFRFRMSWSKCLRRMTINHIWPLAADCSQQRTSSADF